jgi:hypothetical protein
VQLCLYNLLAHLLLYPRPIGLGAPLTIPPYATTTTPLQESTVLCVLHCAGPQPFGYALRTCLAGPNVYSPSDDNTPHIIVCTTHRLPWTLHLHSRTPFTHARPHALLPRHVTHVSLTHSHYASGPVLWLIILGYVSLIGAYFSKGRSGSA